MPQSGTGGYLPAPGHVVTLFAETQLSVTMKPAKIFVTIRYDAEGPAPVVLVLPRHHRI
jgi:hypothetical protein